MENIDTGTNVSLVAEHIDVQALDGFMLDHYNRVHQDAPAIGQSILQNA